MTRTAIDATGKGKQGDCEPDRSPRGCSGCGKGEPRNIERTTALWLGEIGESLHAKLANAGLVESRTAEAENESIRFTEFIQQFIADGKTSQGNPASTSTKAKWKTAQNHLVAFYDASRTLESITAQDAQNFRKYLESRRIKKTGNNPNGQPMAENAKRKIITTAKVMFNAAKRLDLIDRNPFEFEVSSSRPNRERDFFITADMTTKLMDAAPNTQWKLRIALWRLAGFRKMEIFGMTWADILWDKGRFLVRSPKTSHHEDRESRLVPIGPVLPYLEAAFNEAEEGTERVVTRYSVSNFNLHKPFLQIIQFAGLKSWPKLFQNLRSSCETEWLDSGMPAHVVANWIGHSVKVQNDNYAQVDDHHFEQFNLAEAQKVATMVATKTPETMETEANAKKKDPGKHLVFPGSSSHFASHSMPRRGVEPPRPLRTHEPESCASANSATGARWEAFPCGTASIRKAKTLRAANATNAGQYRQPAGSKNLPVLLMESPSTAFPGFIGLLACRLHPIFPPPGGLDMSCDT